MAVKAPQTVNDISPEGMSNRLTKMLKFRDEYLEDIENVHLRLQPGNSKTGAACYTVSLIPVVDCPNCSGCKGKCYDLRNVCFQPGVQNDRARNSAIHKADRERFWAEIDAQVKEFFVRELRINVGGDLEEEDFPYLAKLGRRNRQTMILFFTKNYDGINRFLSKAKFPKNVRPIMSAWPGIEMDNPFNLPCSHVLWKDGSTTAPEYGAYYCGGNCSACAFKGEGCWSLKKGEHVIFNAH
jgi:hypothetical protein